MCIEELLFAKLVDQPVLVHVTDGSVFWGLFHSASIETAHGIMLRNARLIKNGKSGPSDGKSFQGVVEFLEIGADDLVKIVKTGVTGIEAGGSLESAASDCIEDTSESGTKISESRIIGDDSSERERDDSSSQLESSVMKVNPVDERQTSGASTSIRSVVDATSDAHIHSLAVSTDMIPPQGSKFSETTQLNVEAQNFGPSPATLEGEIHAEKASPASQQKDNVPVSASSQFLNPEAQNSGPSPATSEGEIHAEKASAASQQEDNVPVSAYSQPLNPGAQNFGPSSATSDGEIHGEEASDDSQPEDNVPVSVSSQPMQTVAVPSQQYLHVQTGYPYGNQVPQGMQQVAYPNQYLFDQAGSLYSYQVPQEMQQVAYPNQYPFVQDGSLYSNQVPQAQAGVAYYPAQYPVPYYVPAYSPPVTPPVMPRIHVQYPYDPRAGQMVNYGFVHGGAPIQPVYAAHPQVIQGQGNVPGWGAIPPLLPPYHQGNRPRHWFPRNSR